jgi:hypothetical protein
MGLSRKASGWFGSRFLWELGGAIVVGSAVGHPNVGVNFLFGPTTAAAVERVHSVERQRSDGNGGGPPFPVLSRRTSAIVASRGCIPPRPGVASGPTSW